ncbi:HNH endonuclease [Citricoccus sp. SGAir0253]|uniref:HNH endonuclease signature motif containing protein n=1 Tax=Citricoccus sp. SGAir0253 TaxID=2567881 RepID=UPI0010CCC193|nr:HNH endonuclease signature motif containing protein [Citricoccus sp. SGAir0253]QCU78394.1 HNH endonuclease [Citricoccus sp. SGAir0253]
MEPDWDGALEGADEAELLELALAAASRLAERLSAPGALQGFGTLSPGPGGGPGPRPSDWSGLSGPPAAGIPTAGAGTAPLPPGSARAPGGAHGERCLRRKRDERDERDEGNEGDAGEQAAPDAVGPWTLPEAHQGVERLSRVIAAVQTSLAGHAAAALDTAGLREEVLGIPPGKCPFRDAPDWLVHQVRIPRAEARRRVHRASVVLPPPPQPSGHQPGPALPRLAEALDGGEVDPAAVDLVASVLQEARQDAVLAGVAPGLVDTMIGEGERLLARHARELAPDSLRKACERWAQWAQHATDPDGAEPTDAQRAARQGLRYRGRRRGLHVWHLEADDHQHEVLSVVARTAANPRSPGDDPETTDRRSTAQRRLDGLVAALTGALALTGDNGLPASGGLRPQVLVTIDHETLAGRLAGRSDRHDPHDPDAPGEPGGPPLLRTFRSEASFTGIVSPRLVRTLACDAELLPVVLGGEGQVLDVGRAQRLFPARLRKAITARDGGCAAPGCTIPAPWCEVHHVHHWEHGGPTSVDNGVLLCSHHHHAVHGGSWAVAVRDGVPWFTPAPHLDVRRVPRRNRHWRA